jgi:hypothetical protein
MFCFGATVPKQHTGPNRKLLYYAPWASTHIVLDERRQLWEDIDRG